MHMRPQDTSRSHGHMVRSAINPKPTLTARGQGQPCQGEDSSPKKAPLIRLGRVCGRPSPAPGVGRSPLGSGCLAGHACGHPRRDPRDLSQTV